MKKYITITTLFLITLTFGNTLTKETARYEKESLEYHMQAIKAEIYADRILRIYNKHYFLSSQVPLFITLPLYYFTQPEEAFINELRLWHKKDAVYSFYQDFELARVIQNIKYLEEQLSKRSKKMEMYLLRVQRKKSYKNPQSYEHIHNGAKIVATSLFESHILQETNQIILKAKSQLTYTRTILEYFPSIKKELIEFSISDNIPNSCTSKYIKQIFG